MTRNAVPVARLAPSGDRHAADAADVLARRDVVLVPLAAVLLSSLGFLASQLLRPRGELAGTSLAVVDGLGTAVVVLSIVALFGVFRWWNRLQRPLLLMSAYVAFLAVEVAVAAALDGGLASIEVLAFMLVAPYLALILPARWSWPALGGLLALMVGIALAGGTGRIDSAATLFAMVVVSFVAGLLPRRAQERAVARSVRLARIDGLTGLLNRRGFAEHADHALWIASRDAHPVALALVDLNGFKQLNDREGHAAGDELLVWVGEQLAGGLPTGAFVGRTGGDEFAILFPATSEHEATVAARALHARLGERAGASIGVAVADGDTPDRPTLLQRADELLYLAKADPTRRVQVGGCAPVEPPAPASVPAISLSDLRAGCGDADPPTSLADPRWVLHGHLISLATGALVIAGAWLWGQDTFWGDWLRWSGLVWIAASIAWAFVLRGRDVDADRPPMRLLAPAIVLAAIGIMDAALADGAGITAPVTGAFYLAIMHLASVASRIVALRCTAILVTFWLGAVVLGPADVRWAVPYLAALLMASVTLGLVARGVLADAARTERRLALEDPLTGVLNRRAFVHAVELSRVDVPDAPSGFVAVDLDDFKSVNDRLGHAEGDRVLAAVAETMQRSLGDDWLVGRVGGDEFVAYTPAITRAALEVAAGGLDGALAAVAAGSVGTAQFGADGSSLGQVAAVADRRSYARKLARRAAQPDRERSA